MPDDIKNLFAGIPENAKICIWGAANAGRSIKEELAKYRQEMCIRDRILVPGAKRQAILFWI